MDTAKRYAIAYKGLENGTYGFDFKVDGELFEAEGNVEIKGGDCDVHVDMTKSESMLECEVAIKGHVITECDRCLEDCSIPIDYRGTLLVRFSDETDDYDGEVMWLPVSEREVDLAQYIYESIVLALPYRRVHPDGECNPDMLARFSIAADEGSEAEGDE